MSQRSEDWDPTWIVMGSSDVALSEQDYSLIYYSKFPIFVLYDSNKGPLLNNSTFSSKE